MSGDDNVKFSCDYSKRKSNCKKCKQPIEKGKPRIAKITPNFFNDGEGEMKNYHHIPCMFEVFSRARATTKKIEDPSDLSGFIDLEVEEKDQIRKLISELNEKILAKAKTPKKKSTPKKSNTSTPNKATPIKTSPKKVDPPSTSSKIFTVPKTQIVESKDNQFREFRRLCAMIAEESSYNEKTNIVRTFFDKGPKGKGFSGDLYTFVKLLLPGVIKRTYNLQNKSLVKIFSRIFDMDADDMMEHLEQGDVSETIFEYFEKSNSLQPCKKSALSIHDVDHFLDKLEGLTREDEHENCLSGITKKCTANDLKTIIRLIKADLRITAGPKHILDAFDTNAHEAFKASRDLSDVIGRILEKKKTGSKDKLEVRASLMTPVAPMLAEACKSIEYAMKKCPNGMYSEIKYDGERVQLHMEGSSFNFYSRSLKPVQHHKVAHFEKHVPLAFPGGNRMILDSEVLLVDNKTGNPLPFGTLGVHKKNAFNNATVCLFVFDILHFNGKNLMKTPLKERRRLLKENIKEIPNRILLSEMKHIDKPSALKDMILRVIKEGLEGLVLKDVMGVYEPGKRHWLKMKKDYLCEGAMADTADLVVLGGYFGTGNKGGMMSVFLMGVYDKYAKCWKTVTKVGNGHDDDTLEYINKTLKVKKISREYNQVPSWLKVSRQHVPDFIVEDPKHAPVWEITGTEFSKSDAHTASGISIRFPRVTKIRADKNCDNATDLERLQLLFQKSKEESDVSLLLGNKLGESVVKIEKGSPQKRKQKVPVVDHKRKKLKKEVIETAPFLANVFKDMVFLINKDVPDYKLICRYIIAYNGDLANDYDLGKVTHAVQSNLLEKTTLPSTAKLITVEDLKRAIKEKSI